MEWPLLLAGAALGAAATPHCALMCSAPCAAVTQGSAPAGAGFHLGRLLGYMAAGAVVASSMALLGRWGQSSAALRPLWTLLQLAFFALGLWWLVTGRQPAGLLRASKGGLPIRLHGRIARPLRTGAAAGFAGLAWVAWPCAALQAALLLAALSSSALGGAAVMAAFAIASLPGLAAAPWAWARWRTWQARRGAAASRADIAQAGMRIAGLGLMAVSGCSLTHGIWQGIAAWCLA